MAGGLIIVAARIPAWSSARSGGDPAAVLRAALELQRDALWFGWSGRLVDEEQDRVRMRRDGPVAYAELDLTAAQHQAQFNGFSSNTLWPLLHDLPSLVRFDAAEFAAHAEASAGLARRLAPLLRTDDRVWVHDYHLMPLARLLRQAGVAHPLGFFLHLPFPAPDRLLSAPWHQELAEDLAAYDAVGFQTMRDRDHFRDFLEAVRLASSRGRLRAGHGPASVVHPMGIHTRAAMHQAATAPVDEWVSRLGRRSRHVGLIVGADRLDHAKGLLERLRAYERLLADAPELHGTCCLVHVTTPAWDLSPGDLDLRRAQRTLALRINNRFSALGWRPVYDVYGALSETRQAALYRRGRVGLALPLADGVNLAAKEYVAAQDARDPGTLVLSRRSGSAELLSEALLVEPRDEVAVAATLRAALEMPIDERRDRWRRMLVKLLHHDALQWHHSLIDALARTPRALAQGRSMPAPDARVLAFPRRRVVGMPNRLSPPLLPQLARSRPMRWLMGERQGA